MKRELWFVIPGDPDTRTGGYGYDREIVSGLRRRGWTVHLVSLPGEYPAVDDGTRHAAARALATISDGSAVVVDGLAFGVLPVEAARERARLRLIALVHHPLALETGLTAAEADRLRTSERQALESAAGVIVTSPGTVAAVEALGVGRNRIDVVEPGTHPAPAAEGSTAGPVRLLSVASVVPRKGHDTLFSALTQVSDLQWQLTCVGSVDRDPRWATDMQVRCSAPPLAGRIEFAGELEGAALEAAYHGADLFLLPTRYEGYGMVVAEALARGVPVVSTPTGKIADLVRPGTGELVPPDDPAALASVLRRLIGDRTSLDQLKAAARSARAVPRTWETAAEHMERALLREPGR